MTKIPKSERRGSAQKGAVLIEFALSFTVLAMLSLGAVSFGLAVQQSILVGYAANAGAQYGANAATNGESTTGMQTPDVSGMTQAALNAGQGVSGLTVSSSYWCTCTQGGTTNQGCLTSCSNDQTLTYVSVTAGATVPNYISFGSLLPSSFKLQWTSVLQIY